MATRPTNEDVVGAVYHLCYVVEVLDALRRASKKSSDADIASQAGPRASSAFFSAPAGWRGVGGGAAGVTAAASSHVADSADTAAAFGAAASADALEESSGSLDIVPAHGGGAPGGGDDDDVMLPATQPPPMSQFDDEGDDDDEHEDEHDSLRAVEEEEEEEEEGSLRAVDCELPDVAAEGGRPSLAQARVLAAALPSVSPRGKLEVELVGVATAVFAWNRKIAFGLDDGTATIVVIAWCPFAYELEEVRLGQLFRVLGRVTVYQDVPQIEATHLVCLDDDPGAESLHHLRIYALRHGMGTA